MAGALRLALAALLVAGAGSVAAGAQPAPATRPSKAQVDNAAAVLRVIISALQSDKVEQPVKNALFECVYANPVSKISQATDKIIAGNAGKVDRKNPSQMLVVIAGACGYRPAPAGPAKPAVKK